MMNRCAFISLHCSNSCYAAMLRDQTNSIGVGTKGARGATGPPNDPTGEPAPPPPIIRLHVIVYNILYRVCSGFVDLLLIII